MKTYSYDEILEATEYMAPIVTTYGERFLPIFERLQNELELSKVKRQSLELAKRIANESFK